MNKPSVEEIAQRFGCSPDQVRAQFRKNAAHVRRVITRLQAGESSSNYTPSDIPMLMKAAENYETKASPLTVRIVGSAVGSCPPVAIATLNDASAKFRAFIEENGFGSRDAGQCFIYQGTKIVARVAFNGKVFEGKQWTPDAVPIFDPTL